MNISDEDAYQIWYRLKRMQKAAPPLVALLNRVGTKEEKLAYKDGFYSVFVGLDCMIFSDPANDGLRRRMEAMDADNQRKADEYFASVRKEQPKANETGRGDGV